MSNSSDYLLSREKSNGTKTHWNRVKSLQKLHRRNNNRQGSSGRDFFLLKTHWHLLIELGIVFSHINPYNFAVTLKLQRSRKGHGLYLSKSLGYLWLISLKCHRKVKSSHQIRCQLWSFRYKLTIYFLQCT